MAVSPIGHGSYLEGVPENQLAAIWCRLNCHERDDRIKPWPANWDEMTGEARQKFIWPIMCEIMKKIGLKECLREWNKERMPGKEFDDWWARGKR